MFLVLAVPYLVAGDRAPALVSTVVGGSTIAFGLRTLKRVRFLAFWSVAAVVLTAFAVGVVLSKLLGYW